MITNVLAFGSNLGDRQSYIDAALDELISYDEIDIVRWLTLLIQKL